MLYNHTFKDMIRICLGIASIASALGMIIWSGFRMQELAIGLILIWLGMVVINYEG
ncbi:hypothetical protein HOC35_07230 [Candidatus Woesearchaeota archaeon]|jgi:hypothetical protein|nr:hypothetical protein [Candidatus Woesearchaeota archaeon]